MLNTTIRVLTEADTDLVTALDNTNPASDLLFLRSVASTLDMENYAWGIFTGKDLIGYCTLGYADGIIDIDDETLSATWDCLLLSDVFVLPEYRHKGIGKKLILTAINKRLELETSNRVIFCEPFSDDLIEYYKSIGFVFIEDKYLMMLDLRTKDEAR